MIRALFTSLSEPVRNTPSGAPGELAKMIRASGLAAVVGIAADRISSLSST